MDPPTLHLGKKAKPVSIFDVHEPNPQIVQSLVEMGFSKGIAEMGSVQTGNRGIDIAMEWCLSHPDFTPTKKLDPRDHPTSPKEAAIPLLEKPSDSNRITTAPPTKKEELRTKQEEEKHRFQEKLRLQELEKQRKERQAEKERKERIKKQIEEDKERRRLKMGIKPKESSASTSSIVAPVTSPSKTSPTSSNLEQTPTKTVISIRFPSGETTLFQGVSDDCLRQVFDFVAKKMGNSDFVLLIPFPHREFSHKDAPLTLVQAELTPSGSLVVQPLATKGVLREETRLRDDQVDIDKMTYEQILRLEQKIGSVEKGLSKTTASHLPTEVWNASLGLLDDKCLICQCEYEQGDLIMRMVVCPHVFHKDCVLVWLSSHTQCPVCKQEIGG